MYICVLFLDKVFRKSETCNLSMKPYNFTNPVAARYVRVIPIQWIGASACLRMELFGCTVEGKAKKFQVTIHRLVELYGLLLLYRVSDHQNCSA